MSPLHEPEDLEERVRAALSGDQPVCAWDTRKLPGGTIVTAMAVQGRRGVFIGYGVNPDEAMANAWRCFRDRNGTGYKVEVA